MWMSRNWMRCGNGMQTLTMLSYGSATTGICSKWRFSRPRLCGWVWKIDNLPMLLSLASAPLRWRFVENQNFTSGCSLTNVTSQSFVTQCQEDCDVINKHINDETAALGRKTRVTTWFRPYNENNFIAPPMSREEVGDGIFIFDRILTPLQTFFFSCNSSVLTVMH